MLSEDNIRALELFIEKSVKLKDSSFVKHTVENSGVKLSVGTGKPTVIERLGANDESIEAFVLTFRFFIQDNEIISLRNIKDIFQSNTVPENVKLSFTQAKDQLNSFLNGNTMTLININGSMKRRDIMDTFIYGGLSHANIEKKEIYDQWIKNPVLSPFMQNEFSVILYQVLNTILHISSLCENMLNNKQPNK